MASPGVHFVDEQRIYTSTRKYAMFMFTVKCKTSFFAAASTSLADKDGFSNPRHGPILFSIRDKHSAAKMIINGFSKRVFRGFELFIF